MSTITESDITRYLLADLSYAPEAIPDDAELGKYCRTIIERMGLIDDAILYLDWLERDGMDYQ